MLIIRKIKNKDTHLFEVGGEFSAFQRPRPKGILPIGTSTPKITLVLDFKKLVVGVVVVL